MKKLKITLTVFVSLAAILLAASVASAAEFKPGCITSVQFEPNQFTIDRNSPETLAGSMKMVYSGDDNNQGCSISVRIYDPQGNEISNENNAIVDLDGTGKISILKDPSVLNALTEDGIYTIKIGNEKADLLDGSMYLKIQSGAVLGVFSERGESAIVPMKMINLTFYFFIFLMMLVLYREKLGKLFLTLTTRKNN